MYADWPSPAPGGGTHDEMMLGFDRRREHRLLVLAPLFEEANRFRHQIVEIMRRLDMRDIDCFCPDLPGCNESTTPLREQTLDCWRDAAQAASAHVGATHVLAIRSGCWLAPAGLPGWLYVPPRTSLVLRAMVRARIIAARETGCEETGERLLSSARATGIELAGWELGPELVAEMEREEIDYPDCQTIVKQADIGGKPLWLRAENDDDPEQADALAALVAIGMLDA